MLPIWPGFWKSFWTSINSAQLYEEKESFCDYVVYQKNESFTKMNLKRMKKPDFYIGFHVTNVMILAYRLIDDSLERSH